MLLHCDPFLVSYMPRATHTFWCCQKVLSLKGGRHSLPIVVSWSTGSPPSQNATNLASQGLTQQYQQFYLREKNNLQELFFLFIYSLHLAVYLLDFFMDNFDVSRNQLNLVAMGCLSVATKFEEKEEDIPKQNVLRQVYAEDKLS